LIGLAALFPCRRVKPQIQRQNVNARLAEETGKAPLSLVSNQPADLIFWHIARFRDPRHLE
jgi:hypothetical protein